jgi:hypothetical protein
VIWFCPDDGFLAFSWLLAARVFLVLKKIINVFSRGV